MVDISDKVLTMAGLRPEGTEEEAAATAVFTPDDEAPIELD